MDLEPLLPVIRDLGIAGVLLVVLAWMVRRYDHLEDETAKQIRDVNERRVAEAKNSAKDLERQLEVTAQLTQSVATSALAFQAASRSLDLVTERLERMSDRSERRVK